MRILNEPRLIKIQYITIFFIGILLGYLPERNFDWKTNVIYWTIILFISLILAGATITKNAIRREEDEG